MTWRGNEVDETGFGQFEENGELIHLKTFADYMYLQRLFDIRKATYQMQGKREVLNTVKNYVEGLK